MNLITGIKNMAPPRAKYFLLLGMLMLTHLFIVAQNMNIISGGLTIGSGSSINAGGTITVGSGTTITNNSTILLTGDWTNNGGTYTGAGGTVHFKGAAAQSINGSIASHTLNNVVVNQSPASTVSMTKDLMLSGSLSFTSGKLIINSNLLTLGGAVTNTVAQGLIGSNTSSIMIQRRIAAGILSFDQTTATVTNVLRNLTLDSNATATLGNALNIAAGTTTAPGTVTLDSASTLTTGDFLTLKSDASGTSRIAQIPVNGAGVALGAFSGKVMVERYVSSKRAWRLVGVPLQNTGAAETTIWNAWQEGANNTVDLSTGGNYPTDNQNPVPGFGTHVTCDQGMYNPATTGFDAASRFSASLLSYTGTNWGGRPTNTKTTYITSQPGWMLFVRGSRAVNLSFAQAAASDPTVTRVKGLLITGKQTFTTLANPSGYTLLSNPFASGIDLTKCTLNGAAIPGYYVWDPYILSALNVGAYT